MKRIFRYLKLTKNGNLTYRGNDAEINNTDLNFFCDADWGNGSDWKSISGYITIIAGGAVAWSSKKQQTVALSTAEAEYIAATHITKQVLWPPFIRNSISHFQWHLPSLLTIKQPLQSHIIPNFMLAQSTSISITISYKISSLPEQSILFMSILMTT